MTKYFCDVCGDEVTDANKPEGGGRVGATLECETGKLHVEILTTWRGTANAGCFCKYCVLDALSKLDDRPKCAVS